jgi:MEDS: MEthanogen/methylotroph, DcmR Sensory domain
MAYIHRGSSLKRKILQNNSDDWQHGKANVFWGEIAPCDHVVQIYDTEGVFLDTLAGFVGAGINANDACIVIATPAHLSALEERLTSCGISITGLIDDNRYFPLDAEKLLSEFMVDGWPDEVEFNNTVSTLLKRARGFKNRQIRAFGEMVAVLWAQGNTGATVNLEHLWNKFVANESFCLFCAYPKVGITDDIADSIRHICSVHSKMIDGTGKQLTEVTYPKAV